MNPEASPQLPFQPPRAYRMRDCYRGRVWRNPLAAMARDGLVLGTALALAGIAYGESGFMLLGVVVLLAMALIGHLSTLRANLARVRLIRDAPAVEAVMGPPRRVFLVHEMFRGERERTFVLPYTFEVPDGDTVRGRVWICGCARPKLPPNSRQWVAYEPARPRRSLVLRLAMMVAPH
mgnify:FL=1